MSLERSFATLPIRVNEVHAGLRIRIRLFERQAVLAGFNGALRVTAITFVHIPIVTLLPRFRDGIAATIDSNLLLAIQVHITEVRLAQTAPSAQTVVLRMLDGIRSFLTRIQRAPNSIAQLRRHARQTPLTGVTGFDAVTKSSVVTGEFIARLAAPIGACVTARACIAIFTGIRIVGVDTPGGHIAAVIGAWIFVLTAQDSNRLAEAISAGIAYGAGIAIIAVAHRSIVATPPIGLATIRRTGVTVITEHRRAACTYIVGTGIREGAAIAVTARRTLGRDMRAATILETTIKRAWVPVGAIKASLTQTGTLIADIAGGTGIEVVTVIGVGHKGTAQHKVTAVVRASIPIGAG